jgi:hypothetical protein
MKNTLLILALLLALSSQAQYRKYFEKNTLRYDYYHSGDASDEYWARDDFIREGQWAGPRKDLIDPFDYGHYRVMVFDSASNELIFSRGYSSLFYEYRSTEEAKTQCGNYPESVVMPFPKKPVRLEFHSRQKDLSWKKMHEVTIDPATTDVNVPSNTFYPYLPLHRSGNPKKKLDLVFLPEGYTLDEMEKFRADCAKFRDWLFATDPYGEYEKKINIWMVLAASEESGTDIPGDSIYRNTIMNSNFYTFGSERYLTTGDYKAVRNLAANAPCDQVVILVNSEKYGGGGIYNFYAISTTGHPNSDLVFTHEFGHSFAGLGDEYYNSEVAVEDFYPLNVEPWEPNITTLVDFDSKWQDMLAPGTPVPTPADSSWQDRIGVFEGGGYMAKGVYRPFMDCSMNVIKFNNFCPVCQRSIRRMIEYYSK